MIELLTAFAGGLLGSVHCIGMCGGFVALVGAQKQPLCQAVSRQLNYALGRVFTYGFLGAVGGFAGDYLSRFDGAILTAQRVFSVTAGGTMILVGAATLGWVRFQWLFPQIITRGLVSVFRQFMSTPISQSPVGGSRVALTVSLQVFVAGAANGFLPCGLVYAFLAMAVASGSVLEGFLTMLVFGAGTIPVMTLVGCGSTMVTNRARMHVLRIVACLVILTGAVSINRGLSKQGECCSDNHKVATPLN